MTKRRTKDQIAADAAADAKAAKQHNRVRELLSSIKSAHHARNRGLVVQQAAQLHQLAVALLDQQVAAAKASVPAPGPEGVTTEGNDEPALVLS